MVWKPKQRDSRPGTPGRCVPTPSPCNPSVLHVRAGVLPDSRRLRSPAAPSPGRRAALSLTAAGKLSPASASRRPGCPAATRIFPWGRGAFPARLPFPNIPAPVEYMDDALRPQRGFHISIPGGRAVTHLTAFSPKVRLPRVHYIRSAGPVEPPPPPGWPPRFTPQRHARAQGY